MEPEFLESLCLRLRDSEFRPERLSELTWSFLDAGPLFGAIVVERLRTFGGRVLETRFHEARFARGLSELGLESSLGVRAFAELGRLLTLNRELVSSSADVCVVLIASPGVSDEQPTCVLHLAPLPIRRLQEWHRSGVALLLSQHQTVPTQCWSSDIKTRSRLHYLLADKQIKAVEENSLAVLQTSRHGIADTSVANILVVSQGRIVSPRKSDIVVGTSLEFIEELLDRMRQSISYRDVEVEECLRADEILLTGNSGCVWHARSLDGHVIGDGMVGPVCRQIQEQWCDAIGFDWRNGRLLREPHT